MNFCEYVNFKSSGCVNNNVKYLVLKHRTVFTLYHIDDM